MPLSLFKKTENLLKRLMKQCDNDERYSITLVATNMFNIHDTGSHEYTMKYFKNGKKQNSYGITAELWNKYEGLDCFEYNIKSPSTYVIQYKPTSTNWCTIRKDIQRQEYRVPVGTYFISGSGKYQYKWVGSNFYILSFKKWKKANSIDFEFL